MADKSNDNMMKIGLIVGAAVLAFMFAGPKQTAKTQQNNVDQLPALQQRVSSAESGLASLKAQMDTLREAQRIDYSSLRESLAEIQRVQAQQLDRDALNDAFQSLRDALEALEGQLNRRIQLEVKDPIYSAIEDLKADLEIVAADAEDNENKVVVVSEKVSSLIAQVDALHRGGGE